MIKKAQKRKFFDIFMIFLLKCVLNWVQVFQLDVVVRLNAQFLYISGTEIPET